jgi:hypothetical protein
VGRKISTQLSKRDHDITVLKDKIKQMDEKHLKMMKEAAIEAD